MIPILVASTKQQRLFYLTEKYSREELQEIRLREQFFCPSCQAPVILKIGEINIPHFAHKNRTFCDSFSEPESSLHLHGKLLLHHFFHRLHFKVELEAYLTEIRQRADLLVEERYAIEFQCSTIPVSQLKERSNGYKQLHIHPVWIKGLKEPCREEIGVLRLKSYEVAMQQNAGSVPHLLLLHPPGNRFYYHSNLFYVSANRWVGKTRSLEASKQIFPFAVPKQLSKEEFKTVMGIFQHVKRQYIRNQLYPENRVKNRFCRLCYELQVDVMNVSAAFGVPCMGAECLKQPAVFWQLQAVWGWQKGISVEVLIASGKLVLTDPQMAIQATAVVTDYLALYQSCKDKTLKDSSFLDIVYDNYCKNVRKLRK